MAYIHNASTCCGLSELVDLYRLTKANVQLELNSSDCRTMVLATVNQRQIKGKKVLESVGFKTLKKFRNANTGNWVWLMGYDKSAQRRR